MGRALQIARLLIAIGLFVGIAVFAVYTIEELKAGPPTGPPPTDFGASTNSPNQQTTPSTQGKNPLAGLTTPDPNNFRPIFRDNPHPGEIAPFLDAAPYGQPPYQQPAGGEVWEFCVYQVKDASPSDLVAHYNRQARVRGMHLTKHEPTSANMPGGVVAAWSDGKKGLQVTVSPLPVTEPVQPPLAPPTPLRWVVKYSYPDRTAQP